MRRHRETGNVTPRERGGGNFSPIEGKVTDLLCRIVSEMPDATVAELAEVRIPPIVITQIASS